MPRVLQKLHIQNLCRPPLAKIPIVTVSASPTSFQPCNALQLYPARAQPTRNLRSLGFCTWASSTSKILYICLYPLHSPNVFINVHIHLPPTQNPKLTEGARSQPLPAPTRMQILRMQNWTLVICDRILHSCATWYSNHEQQCKAPQREHPDRLPASGQYRR